MEQQPSPPRTSAAATVLNTVGFVVVVALFLFVSTRAGTRGMGLLTVVWALMQQLDGRISYGWEGREPSGYITGPLATALNVLFAMLGGAMAIWPEAAMGILGWDKA